MKYLFDDWDRIKKNLNNKFIALFLDYDGTLTPIVETPDKAILSFENRRLLERLIKNHLCKIAIISGRALKDIKNLIGLKDIIYVGNHGLEIEGPKIKFESQVSPRLKLIIRHIYEEMVKKLSKIKGVLIEDKGLSISVHYRLVNEKDIQEFLNIFTEITKAYTVRDKIIINSGKKVYEIKSHTVWDKGKVVLWLLARWKFALLDKDILPVYLGDDVTDEDAFKVLKKYLPAGRQEGITIFVGEPEKSNAQYYLRHTQEVKDFLKRIADLSAKVQ